MNLADALHEATVRAAHIERDLLEQMIAAFVVETGCMPTVYNHSAVNQQWLQADLDGDITRIAGHRDRLMEKSMRYRLNSDVPASEAVLIRELDGLRISWRFERRAL